MPKITGIMTAAAAAALLSISPLAAQEAPASGTGDTQASASEAEPGLGLHETERFEVRDRFRAMAPAPVTVTFDPVIGEPVPEAIVPQLQPVPQEIVTVAPATEGYHYFAMADGRIALVDAETYVVVDFIDNE